MWIEINTVALFASSADVTPFAGVWIEIMQRATSEGGKYVTPFAGVWIEIKRHRAEKACVWSLPSRECGLK